MARARRAWEEARRERGLIEDFKSATKDRLRRRRRPCRRQRRDDDICAYYDVDGIKRTYMCAQGTSETANDNPLSRDDDDSDGTRVL